MTVDPATMATVLSLTGLGGLERGVVNAPVLFEAVQRENLISPWSPIERLVMRMNESFSSNASNAVLPLIIYICNYALAATYFICLSKD